MEQFDLKLASAVFFAFAFALNPLTRAIAAVIISRWVKPNLARTALTLSLKPLRFPRRSRKDTNRKTS